jgi:RHS repeat-associated protein
MRLNARTVYSNLDFEKTLYASPLMVMTDRQYTKHYYIEGERICSKTCAERSRSIGGGFGPANYSPTHTPLDFIHGTIGDCRQNLGDMVHNNLECVEYSSNWSISDELIPAQDNGDEVEKFQYFYHPDHLGSSSFISNVEGTAEQHLQYAPFGELTVSQRRSEFDSRYKFSGKEHDSETGYTYFGARYYDSEASIWLSVDPMASARSWVSPYSYCQNSPLNRVDPTGALDWIPPSDGSGNWTAEAGDSPGSLARDAHITQAEAETAVRSANQARGQARTSETMVYEGDEVNVASRSGYIWNSGSSTTNFSTTATSTPGTPSTASNTSGSSSNPVQTANTVATVGGLVTDATREVVQLPTVGYNIAYNSTLLKSVNYLKPISYGLSGITVASDFYLSVNGQQSWGETGLNTTVTGVALGVGGWPGLIIQANYQASKAYMKTIMKHPEWAPYPSNGFRH